MAFSRLSCFTPHASRFFSFLILASLLLAFRPEEIKRFNFQGRAQGTTWHITYYATDSLVGKIAIDSLLNVVDKSLSLYVPNSLVSKWNSSRKGIKTGRHFNTVVKKGIDVFNDTEGLFDITVFPLTNAWGFGPVKPAALPDSQAIQHLLPCIDSKLLKQKRWGYKKKKLVCRLIPTALHRGIRLTCWPLCWNRAVFKTTWWKWAANYV
ncbi:MAG: FAD:protein FMN transferase [Chitinophagaceae bacterium]|nr:FAD:protein FMN transferase [Chitinophagaceae bacterium]